MKTSIFAAAISLAALSAVPAMAQDSAGRPFTGYGNLGFSHSDRGVSDLGGVTGRLGLRFGRFVGAEAEATFGVDDDKSTRTGRRTETELDRSMAAYVVGFAPITERLDLFGRVGVGNTKVETTRPPVISHARNDSINYGVGAQYFLTANDGLRADFTRESYRHGPGRADTYGLSYVRKF